MNAKGIFDLLVVYCLVFFFLMNANFFPRYTGKLLVLFFI